MTKYNYKCTIKSYCIHSPEKCVNLNVRYVNKLRPVLDEVHRLNRRYFTLRKAKGNKNLYRYTVYVENRGMKIENE